MFEVVVLVAFAVGLVAVVVVVVREQLHKKPMSSDPAADRARGEAHAWEERNSGLHG